MQTWENIQTLHTWWLWLGIKNFSQHYNEAIIGGPSVLHKYT